MTDQVAGNWPQEYSNELLIGNPNKSLAICSLWSDRDFVGQKVGTENVAVIGNLYSHGPGVEGIIRNVLSNPSIRTILVVGKDKSESGETLLNFFNKGVEQTDTGWVIPLPENISAADLTPGMRSIDSAIPLEDIETMRRSVEIVDLRNKDWADVVQRISVHKHQDPFAEAKIYPKTRSKVEVMNGEDAGFVFRGSEPEEVWLEILRTIRQFGYKGDSRYSTGTQEILNVVSVIDGDMEKLMKWPSWVGHSPDAVRSYSQQLINGVKLDEEDSYAYGERMRKRKGDQIAKVIERLKTKPSDRGLIVDLWDVDSDFFGASANPPCMTQAWFRVHRGKLYTTFTYRSHDMYGAWIKNVMGDRLLQAYVAKEAGLPLGATTVVSFSAHIYENVLPQIDALLSEHKQKWKFSEDPRGNIIITVRNGEIFVRHENKSGSVTEIHGSKAFNLYKEIWGRNLISRTDHAMYVSHELALAEESIRSGTEYTQDRA